MAMATVPTVHTVPITHERLDRWARLLDRVHATPVLLVAVGHDHAAGQTHVLTVEDLSDRDLCVLLSAALAALDGLSVPSHGGTHS